MPIVVVAVEVMGDGVVLVIFVLAGDAGVVIIDLVFSSELRATWHLTDSRCHCSQQEQLRKEIEGL